MFSPDLFNLYSEAVMKEIEDMQGIVVDWYNIDNRRYADDTVLISESQGQLQKLLNKVVEASKAKGLTINCKRTKCLVASKENIIPKCK